MWSRQPRRSPIADLKDRDLVRLYWPAELRTAFDSLFAVDDAMGDVVAKATEPALAAIKLAWWRERLQELDDGKVPAEPRLQAAADELLKRGVSGAAIARLEDGWATLLGEQPDFERIAERGARLFAMAASLLGATDPQVEAAGRLYGFVAVWRRGLMAARRPVELNWLRRHRFPGRLRPLTAMARLAARDVARGQAIEPEATPGRAAALIAHRLTGRVA
jgi:phytoene synthase